jgi:hypothetical protein
VTLGREASTTRGNALETAEWARLNHLHSLIVVTARYHMPRALTELARALPGVALFPVPVQSGATAPRLRLLAGEYTKWLAAEIGVSGLVWWFRSPPYHEAGTVADFGTKNHTSKQWFSECPFRFESSFGGAARVTNFRIGTLAPAGLGQDRPHAHVSSDTSADEQRRGG